MVRAERKAAANVLCGVVLVGTVLEEKGEVEKPLLRLGAMRENRPVVPDAEVVPDAGNVPEARAVPDAEVVLAENEAGAEGKFQLEMDRVDPKTDADVPLEDVPLYCCVLSLTVPPDLPSGGPSPSFCSPTELTSISAPPSSTLSVRSTVVVELVAWASEAGNDCLTPGKEDPGILLATRATWGPELTRVDSWSSREETTFLTLLDSSSSLVNLTLELTSSLCPSPSPL